MVEVCRHILHYCPKCYGPMEAHLHCEVHKDPHWYCLTPDCGEVVRCNA